MNDDELLASAFRKILCSDRRHYVFVDGVDERPYIVLDSTWTDDDGLTGDEMAAIRRIAALRPARRPTRRPAGAVRAAGWAILNERLSANDHS